MPIPASFFGGLDGIGHADAEGDDRDVLALAWMRALPIGSTKSSIFGTSKEWP
jgi:hypothetical protein